ncbi:MAG: replication-associated recombination protein A, partial [Acidobacteria bacterium]|nr:replication-associated recombination protein A [Acidobacteriota bacterium]
DAIRRIVERALREERGLAPWHPEIAAGDLEGIVSRSGGDARRALNLLERVVLATPPGADGRRRVGGEDLEAAWKDLPLLYDKGGEEHFNLISALHKSVRNGDPDASLYWLARMLEAGEDPLYIARRLVRAASEDIGNADPRALEVALAARDAVHFLGMPEGKLALAQAATYLAAAPKSNALLEAYAGAVEDLGAGKTDPVPLHLRNAVTPLMGTLGYGEGYEYAHDDPEAATGMECLPERLWGRRYYRPGGAGLEKEIAERLRLWREAIAARRTAGMKNPT